MPPCLPDFLEARARDCEREIRAACGKRKRGGAEKARKDGDFVKIRPGAERRKRGKDMTRWLAEAQARTRSKKFVSHMINFYTFCRT